MKIAYFFLSNQSGLIRLIQTILPELENGTHSFDVMAMCFFDENEIALMLDNEIGQRLARLAKLKNIILLKGEKGDRNPTYKISSLQDTNDPIFRTPTECVVITIVDGEQVGCFPDFDAAVGDRKPERFISL